MLVQLGDQALKTILKKEIECQVPDVRYFKRPVTLEFKNLLSEQVAFHRTFEAYFEKTLAHELSTQLGSQPLRLALKDEGRSVRLRLYQTVDLHDYFPAQFPMSHVMDFDYFDLSLGDSFKIHHCSLTKVEEKALALAQVFVLIAYDTLNHLKTPQQRITRHEGEIRTYRCHSSTQKDGEDELLEPLQQKRTKQGVYYYRPYRFEYPKKVERVSKKRISREPEPRFFLKTEWDRAGHWRRIKDRETGKVKGRTWIRETTVTPSEERLRAKSERIVRIHQL